MKHRQLFETYRDFDIYEGDKGEVFNIDGTYIITGSIEAARKCIDVYIEREKMNNYYLKQHRETTFKTT